MLLVSVWTLVLSNELGSDTAMLSIGLFVAGFTSGWIVRGSVDSSRGAVVKGLSALFLAADRVKRAVAMEREHLEDLIAEARAHRASRRPTGPVAEVQPSNKSVRDRAA
jgi:hypothetical protein